MSFNFACQLEVPSNRQICASDEPHWQWSYFHVASRLHDPSFIHGELRNKARENTFPTMATRRDLHPIDPHDSHPDTPASRSAYFVSKKASELSWQVSNPDSPCVCAMPNHSATVKTALNGLAGARRATIKGGDRMKQSAGKDRVRDGAVRVTFAHLSEKSDHLKVTSRH